MATKSNAGDNKNVNKTYGPIAASAKPKPKPSSPEKFNVIDEAIGAAARKLSPSQKKRIADLFGIQYPPKRPEITPSKPYNPKDWEGQVGDKGW